MSKLIVKKLLCLSCIASYTVQEAGVVPFAPMFSRFGSLKTILALQTKDTTAMRITHKSCTNNFSSLNCIGEENTGKSLVNN